MVKIAPRQHCGVTQGNIRVVFTSAAPAAQITSANFEAETNSNFQNYPTGANRSQVEWYNHTSPSPPNTSSQLLTGASSSQVGVARNFKVYPGDKISIEAYAKYFSGARGTPNLAGFAGALTGAFGLSTASTGEAARAYEALNDYGSFVANGNGPGENTFPKAFVNILLFDKDFNFLDIAYEQINGGEQPVGSSSKTAHDHMSREYTVKEAGYAYVYISNENPGYIQVYFDDVTVSYTPTNIIQYNEYYAYGLQASTSWTRENNSNNYSYNSASELNVVTGWYETMFRDYDPVLGRFMQIDPLAANYSSWSPYHYSFNNPVMFNDPDGLEGIQSGPPDWLDDQMAFMYELASKSGKDLVNPGFDPKVMSMIRSAWDQTPLGTSSIFTEFEPVYGYATDRAHITQSDESRRTIVGYSAVNGSKKTPDRDTQQREHIIVHVMAEIVGYTTVKSWETINSHAGGIILLTPFIKLSLLDKTMQGNLS